MNSNFAEDDLGLWNRLLEWLQQVDLKNIGSHIKVVFVSSGAQHVETIQTQIFGEHSQQPHAAPQPLATNERSLFDLPEALATEESMILWQKAMKAGYVDENYQPLLSRTQSALLADAMAERLGIKEKWKVFETFWNRKNMYRDYYKALNLQQSLSFQDEIKKLFC